MRDLALNHQQVFRIAVILMRPEVGLVARLDELRGDANLSRITPDAAFEHILHARFAGNLLQWLPAIFVVHH